MHCFNESAPLANIFDCMKGHNRKLNRLREREGAQWRRRCQDTRQVFEQTDWSGGRQGWLAGLALTREAARYAVTVPHVVPPVPSIQLCIIGFGTDGLLLPLIVTPHPSSALTKERKKS